MYDCERKIGDLKKQREAFILACIESLNKCVTTTFTVSKAIEVHNEFATYGFVSPVVQKFIKDVKDVFFSDVIAKKGEDFIKDITCIKVSYSF